MTTSRPNPFKGNTPRTALGMSGLGAVGGPQGLAAGGLRVIVEFLTQYDGQQLERLRNDLVRLQQLEQQQRNQLNPLLQQQAQIEQRINTAHTARARATAPERRELRDLVSLEQRIDKARQQHRRSSHLVAQQQARIVALATSTSTLTQAQVRDIIALNRLEAQRAGLLAQINALEEQIGLNKEEQLAIEQEISTIEMFRAQLLPKLGALVLGTIGGVFGGALFTGIFQVAQEGIGNVVTAVSDVIDPARRAREALEGVAEAVNSIADEKSLSRLEAAKVVISGFGGLESAFPGGGDELARRIALAGAIQAQKETIDQWVDAVRVANNVESLQAELQAEALERLKATDEEYQNLLIRQNELTAAYGHNVEEVDEFIQNQDRLDEIDAKYAKLVQTALDFIGRIQEATQAAEAFAAVRMDALEASINSAADAAIAAAEAIRDANIAGIEATRDAQLNGLDRAAAGAQMMIEGARDARLGQLQNQLDNLDSGPSQRTLHLQKLIDSLGDSGPSEKTQKLAAAIERINAAEERRAFQEQLSANSEERRNLILERRLSLTDRQINVNRYFGQQRVIALDAEIARLNRVEDLQQKQIEQLERMYQAQKGIRREEGETIKDFLARRALENAKLLAEAASDQRQRRIDQLEREKEGVEFRIKLQENAEARIKLIRDRARKQYMEDLQERLKASQDADRAAAEARRDSLRKQLQASQENDRKTLESKRKAIQDEMEAVRENARKQQEELEKRTEQQRKFIEKQAQNKIDQEKRAADETIATIKRQQEVALAFYNATDVSRTVLAIKGAKTRADLELVAGYAAGSNFAYAQLQAMIENLGLPVGDQEIILGNARRARDAYNARLDKLSTPGAARGAVFPLRNSMNFGSNIRVGEEGTEIGVVLSNKVTQALKSSTGNGLGIENITINTHQDPYRAKYELRQTIREIVRKELRG